MNEDKNWTALFTVLPSNNYSLALSSNPLSAGITTGAGSYSQNVLASITATPNIGYYFTGWLGSGATTHELNSTTVNMNQDRNLTAQFSLKSYKLNLTADSGGSVSGSGMFDHGTNPAIVATPSSGYNFIGWIGSGVTNPNINATTVTMDQDRNLTAQFSPKSYTLHLTAGTGGSVSGAGTFNHDTNTTIIATPNNGYNFNGWTGSGVRNSNARSTTVFIDQDRNLTATFSLPVFKLTLETSGGGAVSGGGSFPSGTLVTYGATADDGYIFKNWSIADQNHSSQHTGSINISYDLTVTAHFEKSLDPALSSAQSLGNNIFSSWLGYFLTFDNGWYYHLKLGWIYPQGNSLNGLWFWSQEAGWFWTNEEIFEESFLWSNSDDDWVFLREGSTVGDTLLFSYKNGGSWNFLPAVLSSD